jgi:hypothetical protein
MFIPHLWDGRAAGDSLDFGSALSFAKEEMKQTTILLSILFTAVAQAGTITYEIVDYTRTIAGTVIASGQKLQVIADIVTVKIEGRRMILWSKSVLLDKGFSIGFSDAKDKSLTGIGMWVQTEPNSFSWEWFDQSAGAIFNKLQEGGRIQIRTHGPPAGQEVAEIEFLTDISLRTIGPGGSGTVLQRVNIKKGSVLSVLP